MHKILALGLAVVALFITVEAMAQCDDLPPIGTAYTCYFIDGGKVIVTPGGPVPSNSIGSATVYVVAHHYCPCEVILSPEQFSSSGSGALGTFTANLAPGSPVSRLTGRNCDKLCPADLELNLNITVRADGLDGTFTSQGPITLRVVGGCPPFHCVEVKQEPNQTLKLINERNDIIGLESVNVRLNCP